VNRNAQHGHGAVKTLRLVVTWFLAGALVASCDSPLEARQCPRGWRYVDRLDTAGWVTRQNGDTLPITVHWQGCFEEAA